MKTTLLITNGIKEVVLTPETKAEKYICKLFQEGEKRISIYHGSFYEECQGGWIREYHDNESIILVLRDEEAKDAKKHHE